MIGRPFISSLVRESLRSGTIASLVIMPVGLLFRFLGLRIGHYGPKLGALLFGNVAEPWFQVLLMVQHFVIGWLSTAPLLLFLVFARYQASPVWYGAIYGAGYYVAVNSLFLPIAFGDPTPWQIGLGALYPSLIGHIVFGISIAVTARHGTLWRHTGVWSAIRHSRASSLHAIWGQVRIELPTPAPAI